MRGGRNEQKRWRGGGEPGLPGRSPGPASDDPGPRTSAGLTRIFFSCVEALVPWHQLTDDGGMTLARHFAFAAIIAITASAAVGAQTRVVDGDTFDLDGLQIRINGIDAPEFGQRCGDWDCGQEALDRLDALISEGDVSCVPLDQDRYGRMIARCSTGDQDIGAVLVEEGLAWAFTRYSADYVETEAIARQAHVGVWQGDYEAPWDYRARKWAEAAQAAPEGCPIKGNISSGGKIYHPPWSPWYGKTRINTSKGERWFCSEDEAIAAGWRAPAWR